MPHSRKVTKEDEYRLLQMGLNEAFYRSFAGYTQEELAEACGMKYINGQSTVTYFGAFLYRKAEG